MKRPIYLLATAMGLLLVLPPPGRAEKAPKNKKAPKTYIAVFDFVTLGTKGGNAQVLKGKPYGHQLSDSVRLKLRKQGKQWEIIDRLTMAEVSGPLGADTDPQKVREILSETLGAHIGLYGQVQNIDNTVRADITCIDLRKGDKPLWSKVFSNDTVRARAVISREIVEAVIGEELWRPPEYGDEPEPARKQLSHPINVNGDFEQDFKGWEKPDNVGTFIVKGPPGRGKLLRVRTDLRRDPWLKYRKALRSGKANPSNPPDIATDTSYGCVGALEGVHYRSDWIKADPGQRYWLLADVNGRGGAKVFVKGFMKTPHALDGLPESSLANLGMTPVQFSALPKEKRRALIEADARKNPMRYVRECYRWYLNCGASRGEWMHFAAPFPPRGGLPRNVEYLQIQIYSYWPPGEYLWDNVHLYKDPNQKAPLPEEQARTPNLGKTSDVVEKESREKKSAANK